MRTKKRSRIVLCFAALSFIVAAFEGYFYYAQYAQYPLFRLILTLYNSVKMFVFSPEISISDIASTLGGTPAAGRALGYVYALAVLTAAICTASMLLYLVQGGVLRLLNAVRSCGRRPIVIFGYNETVRKLLLGERAANSKPKFQFHIVAEQLSENDELEILRGGAIPHRTDLLAEEGAHDRGGSAKKLRRDFGGLKIRASDRLLLMEESPTRNFCLYQMLSRNRGLLKEGARCYCLCEDEVVRDFIEDACDAKKGPELTLFSLTELKAESIFSEPQTDSKTFAVPLYTVNAAGAGRDVHLLIAGFGRVGQQVLLQALNLGVLSSQNRLYIDVVDREIGARRDRFMSRFRIQQSADPDNSEFRVGPPVADGELCIRFHQADVLGQGFIRLLRRLDGEMPLTYAAVCVEKSDAGMRCAAELKKLGRPFPVALRLENDIQMAKYLNKDSGAYADVFPIQISDQLLCVERICDEKRERLAREFHDRYADIQLLGPGENKAALTRWEDLKMYQRRANFRLYLHKTVKDAMGGPGPEDMERWFGANGSILQRKGTSYYSRCERKDLAGKINAEPALRELASTEHRRWCYVMAADGWCWAEKKDETLRQTPYLSTWDRLCKDHPETAAYDLIPYLLVNDSIL